MTIEHIQLLNDWRASGLSQKRFCREKGISFGKLFYARQKELALNKSTHTAMFSRVELKTEQDEHISFTILFPSGSRLELSSLTISQLKELLQ